MENELLRIAQKHYEDQDVAILVDDEEQNMILNNLNEYPHVCTWMHNGQTN